MSISRETPSASTVRGWTTEDVVIILRQNGLEDAVPSFRKRNIDGNAFLKLTEVQLKANWNQDLSFTSVWKINKLLNDIKAQPEKSNFDFGAPIKPFPIPLPTKLGDKSKSNVRLQPTMSLPRKKKGWNCDAGTGLNQPSSFRPIPPGVHTSRRDPPRPSPPLGKRPPPALPVSGWNGKSSASSQERDRSTSPGKRWESGAPSPSVSNPSATKPSGWNQERKPKPPILGNKPNLSATLGGRIGPKGQSPVEEPPREPTSPFAQQQGINAFRPPPIGKPNFSLTLGSRSGLNDQSTVEETPPQSTTVLAQRLCNAFRPSPLCPSNISTTIGSRKDLGGQAPPESIGILAQQLAKALRSREQSNAQQNGRWPPEKAEPSRPKLKSPPAPPVPPTMSSAPTISPTLPGKVPAQSQSYLPMPPPIPTGQEGEHIMEIVSNIRIPSESSEDTMVGDGECDKEDIYEEPPDVSDFLDNSQPTADEGSDDGSGIYEYISEERLNSEYYEQPSFAAVNPSTQEGFESTNSQVQDLPLAPSVPAKSQGRSFMSNLKASLFRSSTSKSPDGHQPREKRNYFKGRSSSPGKEKLAAPSELRKSPTSSTTSLISPTKGNSGQTSDQRLPPNLRPLPPTPGIGPFRPVPPNSTSTVSRKINGPKTPLGQQPWYHNVDRRRGEELVSNREDGTFLIRPSSQNQNPYTLTIWYGNRVYNIAVRYRSDQKYALGSEKPNEQSFWSLEEMVTFYHTEQLVLFSCGERAGQTSLKSSP
ncbi:nascent polypeptide-associated complex subunit alpha, muscle-specific form-like isoform X2 [Ischnura elegans]|uniref:nascent polypeptide-associated complex subunit alpha, muscle-specific form-like isoform X2 n=1 Tax=Ischnura elegans TaxID=197161 RepID=UPI001ED89BF7|nr:nascent polypeptide-associated complex subunit alpha, muscle-specific form-like isoform X2 [Ischnura elegans]